MWLGRKHTKQDSTSKGLSDKMAGKIASVGIMLQTKFAFGMSRLFSKTNTGKLKIALILFCVSGGGYSAFLIGNAITKPANQQKGVAIDHINVPKHFDKYDNDLHSYHNEVDNNTFQKITQFKSHMDSLKKVQSYLYDSILDARPFLMDTVQMLEQIYLSQNKNK
jgi:hypothetical protein